MEIDVDFRGARTGRRYRVSVQASTGQWYEVVGMLMSKKIMLRNRRYWWFRSRAGIEHLVQRRQIVQLEEDGKGGTLLRGY